MASSDDINIRIKVDTSDVPKATKQVSTFEELVSKAVSRMKQAMSLKVDTSGVKEAMSAVKSLNGSLSSAKTNIKVAADTTGIQPAVSAVKNLESSAEKPVTVKTAVSGDAMSSISAIKSNLSSIPRSQTSVVSASDGGSVSKLVSGFQTLGAKAKSAADDVMSIGTLARSSLPSVASTATSASAAVGGIGPAANAARSEISGISPAAGEAASKVNDIGESSESSSGSASKLYDALQKVAAVTMTAVVTGIAAVGKKLADVAKSSYDLLSTSQQVVGGVEAIYGDAANTIKENAKNAFSSAQMSANQYMDIATSLGAVLTNSVGGDSQKAAEIMDTAIRSMSDNSNKMGTDMESVIGTYQSLSRGNYAMLDNLKLGYGGTKAELERLIADTNKYQAANDQLSADNFGDIVRAIDLTQQRLHIAGTSAGEAATTIEGSFNQMKAAWDNFQTDLGKGDAGQIKLDSQNLVASFSTWVTNAKPAIIGIIKGLVQSIPDVFNDLKSLLPKQMQDALSSLSGATSSIAPILAPLGAAFAAFGAGGISPLLKQIPLIGDALSGLTGPLTLLSSPIGMLVAAFAGLVATSPELQKSLGSTLTSVISSLQGPMTVVGSTFQTIITEIGNFVSAIMPPLVSIIQAILPVIGDVATFIGGVLLTAINMVGQNIAVLIPIITNIVQMVLPAVMSAVQLLGSVIKDVIGFIQPIIGAIFNFANELFKTFVTAIVPLLISAIQYLVPIVNDVINSIGAFLDAAKPFIQEVINTVVSFINNVLLPAVKAMVPVIQSIIVTITRIIGIMLNTVKNIINFVTAILRGDWAGAWEAAKNIVSGAIDGIKAVIGGVVDIGKNLITGIWNGIKSNADWLFSKIGGWASDLVDKVKKFFKIGSPSKVFAREIGRYIPQGIAVGINADTSSVLDSLGAVKTEALNEVSGMRMMSTYTSYTPSNTDSYQKVPTYTVGGNQGYSMPLPTDKYQKDSPYQSGQPVILQVNLNGKTIAKETYKDITYLQKRDTSRGM